MKKKKEKIYVTEEGLEKLKKELEKLKAKRPEVADKIGESVAQGDISESFDYEEAKREQGFLEGRILDLKKKIRNAQVIKKEKNADEVKIGSEIKIRMGEDEEKFEIVGAASKDPLNGKLSYNSPLGRVLLGRKKGETFTFDSPGGEVKIKILEIR